MRHATVHRYDQAIEYAVQCALWWRVMDSERRLPITDGYPARYVSGICGRVTA